MAMKDNIQERLSTRISRTREPKYAQIELRLAEARLKKQGSLPKRKNTTSKSLTGPNTAADAVELKSNCVL
jgi:hypothetical protein